MHTHAQCDHAIWAAQPDWPAYHPSSSCRRYETMPLERERIHGGLEPSRMRLLPSRLHADVRYALSASRALKMRLRRAVHRRSREVLGAMRCPGSGSWCSSAGFVPDHARRSILVLCVDRVRSGGLHVVCKKREWQLRGTVEDRLLGDWLDLSGGTDSASWPATNEGQRPAVLRKNHNLDGVDFEELANRA